MGEVSLSSHNVLVESWLKPSSDRFGTFGTFGTTVALVSLPTGGGGRGCVCVASGGASGSVASALPWLAGGTNPYRNSAGLVLTAPSAVNSCILGTSPRNLPHFTNRTSINHLFVLINFKCFDPSGKMVHYSVENGSLFRWKNGSLFPE